MSHLNANTGIRRGKTGMDSMRTLKTLEHFELWKRNVARYSEPRDRVEEAGYLLTNLMSRPAAWRTKAFFEVLYADVDSLLQVAAVEALARGMKLMYYDGGTWNGGPRLSATRQCMRAARPDIFAELVRRGPPPGHPDVVPQVGSTTPAGRWLDQLSSRTAESQSFPECLSWVDRDYETWATFLVDADPRHKDAGKLHGPAPGAVFFELLMKRTVAAAGAAAANDGSVELSGSDVARRRRMGI